MNRLIVKPLMPALVWRERAIVARAGRPRSVAKGGMADIAPSRTTKPAECGGMRIGEASSCRGS
jgi:hypothetical protein